VTAVWALLRTMEQHEREPFVSRVMAGFYAREMDFEAGRLFHATVYDVEFMDDAAEEIRQRLRIAASMAMSEAAGRGVSL
jgi:hypothetical protein